jgi:hypothetical protein
MIKGDPAVYADIGPRGRRVKLCDTLPKYIEKHLVPSRVSEAKTI